MNSNHGAARALETQLRASLSCYLPRGSSAATSTLLAFLKAGARRHLGDVEAVTFAASVCAAVELGAGVEEATRSTIRAWRVARRGGAALWPAAVGEEEMVRSMVASAREARP